MALIKCPECGREVSDQATACPQCGFPIKEEIANAAASTVDRIGQTISFCGYDWRVLDIDRQNNRVLIITSNIVTIKAYHERFEEITWEQCTLRRWLNNDFICSLPTDSRERIVAANVVNQDNPYHGTPTLGGNNTIDKVFLLSIDEANRYFMDDADRVACYQDGQAGWWWLRSPGGGSDYAAYVLYIGNVYGGGHRVQGGGGVRPALWIQI
jgi:hypothetical protein